MPPLSREFLLNRGFCCNLGCVNCPYRIKMSKLSDQILGCTDGESVTIYNKRAYNMAFGKDKFTSKGWDEEVEELELEDGEEALFIVWYFGPLAARGYFVACDKDGNVTKSLLQWIS